MILTEVYNGKEIEKIVELLDKYGKDSKIIAGGTDIIIALRNEEISPNMLIDISKIKDLNIIEEDENYITVGGGVTFTQIVDNPSFKGNLYGLFKACNMVGSPQIRNKGTIGGNIANGSSAADSIPPLICLGSKITLLSLEGSREILLEDYYEDPIREKELLTKIKFKKLEKSQILSFSKLGLRKALAVSRMSISSLINFDKNGYVKEITVASGALGKYPMREKEVEEFLRGKKLEENIDNAVEIIQQSMDERLKGRSTLEYKRIAIESVLKETLETGLEFSNGVNL